MQGVQEKTPVNTTAAAQEAEEEEKITDKIEDAKQVACAHSLPLCIWLASPKHIMVISMCIWPLCLACNFSAQSF